MLVSLSLSPAFRIACVSRCIIQLEQVWHINDNFPTDWYYGMDQVSPPSRSPHQSDWILLYRNKETVYCRPSEGNINQVDKVNWTRLCIILMSLWTSFENLLTFFLRKLRACGRKNTAILVVIRRGKFFILTPRAIPRETIYLMYSCSVHLVCLIIT